MRHLYNSCFRVERAVQTFKDRQLTFLWKPMGAPLDRVHCRLDMTFIRPGKDQPAMPKENGRAVDRVGLLICDPVDLRAGDRIVMVPNDFGQVPVVGTFEVRNMPDGVQGYSAIHHLEVQVIEADQNLVNFGSSA